MTTAVEDPQRRLRRSVYVVLICVSAGAMLGRILAVDSVDQLGAEQARFRKILGGHSSLPEYLRWKRRDLANRGYRGEELEAELERAGRLKSQQLREARLSRPFLSANDRSRWATIRALVEKPMRVPGAPYAIDKVIQEPTWDTIDMVKHGRRGTRTPAGQRGEAPLQPWQQSDGKHLYSSKPLLLPTLLAGIYWAIHTTTGMTLGTHPYAIGRLMLVLVNLLPLVIYFVLLAALVERFGRTDFGRVFTMAAALFGTFLTTFAVVINNHLPAAVCAAVAMYAAVRIRFDGQRRLRYFAVAGLFAAFLAANELPSLALFGLVSLALLWQAPRQTLLAYFPAAAVVAAGFFATNWIAHRSLLPPYLHRSEGDNWYDYKYVRNGNQYESYWNEPQGIDRGEPSPWRYAAHVLVGHHGIFSLTPVWLLSVGGAAMWLCQGRDRRLRELALLISVVTLICLAFYLSRPLMHRNYGGMACGFRWMFWFAPLWLVVMLPAVDAMAPRRWTRLGALLTLLVSVVSASYPTWNPWTFPWIMDFLDYLGWLG